MRFLLLFIASLPVVPAVQAQVGRPPEKSPYSDLRATQAASIIGGYLSGNGGKVGADPADGPLIGVRYDRQIGTPVDIYLGITGARLKRFVLDPNLPPEVRRSGPVDHDLIMMEAGVSLIITGRKTWRGFVPYLGGGLGVAFSAGLGTDAPSGFNFGTKVLLAPHIGFKWYPVQAIAFKVEGRNIMWRLKYPDSFLLSPIGAPNIPPIINPLTESASEWTHHPTLLVSLGYTFTL